MSLYQRDDAASWADWQKTNPPPHPGLSGDEQLRYMAGYYNHILHSGGTVASEVLIQNPYVHVWDNAVRKYVPREESIARGPGPDGIVPGPYDQRGPAPSNPKVVPVAGVTAPAPAPRSLWQRIKEWFRRLFA